MMFSVPGRLALTVHDAFNFPAWVYDHEDVQVSQQVRDKMQLIDCFFCFLRCELFIFNIHTFARHDTRKSKRCTGAVEGLFYMFCFLDNPSTHPRPPSPSPFLFPLDRTAVLLGRIKPVLQYKESRGIV